LLYRYSEFQDKIFSKFVNTIRIKELTSPIKKSNDSMEKDIIISNTQRQIQRQTSKKDTIIFPQEKSQSVRQLAATSTKQHSDMRSRSRKEEEKDHCHPRAHLFHAIDRNGTGEVTVTEFIHALGRQPEVAAALRLPQEAKQEDGSRDMCVMVFNAMDDTNTSHIDSRKFLGYLDKICSYEASLSKNAS
jgi:hypothetical protein